MIAITITTARLLVILIVGDDDILDACSVYIVFCICSENMEEGRE